ncbi:hypothetical protein ARMSODRAFT_965256 [Armillaria solidipes]|uniref:Uncharacterized protein n=1 Tax=Armillaria solidipes TaxID=1076256 RepID=A0A2H3AU28_9AGAR|nr:hypothetical protein ARMSODRAFT_965256 [Armillaria solidipes]
MRPPLLVCILVVPFIVSGAAQDLTPSISWKNPNITSSKDERISIVSAALDKAVSMLQSNGQFNDSSYGIPGRLCAQMAEFDRLTNQTKYKQTLKQYFALAETVSPEFLNKMVDYGLNYGYAAARAYTAYQDPDFLALAVTSWASARRYTISKEQAALGTIDVKQFNLSTSCQGATLTGGTYVVSHACIHILLIKQWSRPLILPKQISTVLPLALFLLFRLYWQKQHLTRRISMPPSSRQILYSRISSIRPIP